MLFFPNKKNKNKKSNELKEAKEEFKKTLKHLKISSLQINNNKNEKFRKFCFDEDIGFFFSDSKMNIFHTNPRTAKEAYLSHSKANRVSIKYFDFSKNLDSNILLNKIVPSNCFEYSEEIMDLFIYETLHKIKILIIITNTQIFQLKIDFAEQQQFKDLGSPIQVTKQPTEIFSVSELAKNYSMISKFSIQISKVFGGCIYLKLFNLESESYMENNPKYPFYILLKLTFEKSSNTKDDSIVMDSMMQQEDGIEICDISNIIVYQREVGDLLNSAKDDSILYFSIRNKVYLGKFNGMDSLTKNRKSQRKSKFTQNLNFHEEEFQLVYRGRKKIEKMEASPKMENIYLYDTSNRVTKFKSDTWKKSLAFQIKKGTIKTFSLCETQKILYM